MKDLAEQMARECLAMRARRLNRLVTRLYDEGLRPFGITVAQMNLLVAVALHGPVSATGLARGLDLEKSTLSRNLALLAEHGWVTRGRNVEVTAAGKRLIERIHPVWQRAQVAVKERIGHGALDALETMAHDLRD